MTEFRCPVCDYKYGYVPKTSDNCHTCGVGFAFITRVKNDWIELQRLKDDLAKLQRIDRDRYEWIVEHAQRDVKLADEIEARAKALEDCYFEEWNSCHYPDLHTTWETLKKVVGALRK